MQRASVDYAVGADRKVGPLRPIERQLTNLRRASSNAAKDGAFLPPTAGDPGNRLVDASGEPAERQRLQPDATRPRQRREEQSFASKERRLDTAHELEVVVDRWLHRDDAAGVDAKRLACLQVERVDHAASVREAHAVAVEAFHNEPFASEQADSQAPLKGDADRDATRGAEK